MADYCIRRGAAAKQLVLHHKFIIAVGSLLILRNNKTAIFHGSTGLNRHWGV